MNARSTFVLLGAAGALFFATTPSHAQDRVTLDERERSAYHVEIEPHMAFGPGGIYDGDGVGAGLRVGIPLAAGHLGSVPQNIALSVGGDWLHYESCYFSGRCGADYILVPVAVQWNVFVTRPVSLFAEGGLVGYHGFLDECTPDSVGCSRPSRGGVLPDLALGIRGHVSDSVAIVGRLGYPVSSVGISFM